MIIEAAEKERGIVFATKTLWNSVDCLGCLLIADTWPEVRLGIIAHFVCDRAEYYSTFYWGGHPNGIKNGAYYNISSTLLKF